MSDVAIRIENLSKQYRISGTRTSYRTLRDTLTDAFVSSLRRVGSLWGGQATKISSPTQSFWALRDVFCEIKSGEVVGIIGYNGAGKSTMLKILSRITEPTAGFVEIRGRVASLLEVGTGFHPELTGRENISLNGAILGMKRAEIDHKFDEIVAFAEVERFIDTPVKHYSSGMYLRLAFAVAAHLEPEILLIDEILAVGDVRFQKKCLSKMQDVEHQGRTVLFVSHDMQAITRLCKRAILLDEGRVLRDGPSHQVVGAYLNSELGTTGAREWLDAVKAPGNDIVRLCAVRIKTEDGQVTDVVDIRQSIRLEMEYEVLKPGHILMADFGFENEEGVYIFASFENDPAWQRCPRSVGHYVSTVWIPGNFLAEGTVIVGAGVSSRAPYTKHFEEPRVVVFQVIDSLDGNSARGDYGGRLLGVVRPLLDWSTQFNPNPMGLTESSGGRSNSAC